MFFFFVFLACVRFVCTSSLGACEKEGRAAFKCLLCPAFPDLLSLGCQVFFRLFRDTEVLLPLRVYNIFVKLVRAPSIDLGLHTMEVGLPVQYWPYWHG